MHRHDMTGTIPFVFDRDTDLKYFVYNVRDDSNGYPQFLVYKDHEWKYISAKHFYCLSIGNAR